MNCDPTSGMSGLLREQVRHGADVVLVAVGQHDRLDVVESVHDGREVGQDQVDAGLVLLGEQHAAVDDQQLAVVLEDGHVATDLAEAAQRDDPQGSLAQRRDGLQFAGWLAHRLNPASAASNLQLGDLFLGRVHQRGPDRTAG